MTKVWRPRFNPLAEYVVSVKGLMFGERVYEPGEKFDINSTSPRQARILYENRYLDLVEPEKQPATEDDNADTAPRVEEEAADDTLGSGVSAPAPENAPARKLSVRAIGRGWYDVVDEDGNKVNTERMKEQAAKDLAAKG